MNDKLIELDDVAGLFTDGMTIGIGGWGSRRKPMALVRAIVRSGAQNLTIVSFGGADVGILCATGQASTVMHAFVSLDTIAVEPHFAARRQAGTIENVELDEGMLVAGLRAAGRRLPFEVTRAGLGSDAVERNAAIQMIQSPYADGEHLVAMPAIPLDIALLHLDRADARGSAQVVGPDPYFDELFARAATRTVVSVEEVVDTAALTTGHPLASVLFNRTMVSNVVHAPHGAHFTAAAPNYGRDEALQRAYADSAASPAAWAEFHDLFINVDEVSYARNVAEFHKKGGTQP